MTQRVTAPEILDSLPPNDPAAVAGRRDLRRINAIMGNHRWICRRMADWHGTGSILEIGAGDGSLARRICQEYPHLAARYHAIDLAPCPGHFPAGATWHEKNLWSPDAAALLADAHIAARRRGLGAQSHRPVGVDPRASDTVYLCTADDEGRFVSFIHSASKPSALPRDLVTASINSLFDSNVSLAILIFLNVSIMSACANAAAVGPW